MEAYLPLVRWACPLGKAPASPRYAARIEISLEESAKLLSPEPRAGAGMRTHCPPIRRGQNWMRPIP